MRVLGFDFDVSLYRIMAIETEPMDAQKRYWRQRYDEAAAESAEDYQVGRWISRHYYAMVQVTIRQALVPWQGERLRILDVCCGSGALLETLRDLGFSPVGMDISVGAIGRLKETQSRSGFPAVVADAARLPFDACTFDGVVSVGMLQCIKDLNAYFQELARVLPDTRARLLVLFSPTSVLVRYRRLRRRRTDPDMAHYVLHSPRAVRNALRAAGFRQVDTRHHFYIFYAPLLRPLLRFLNLHPRLGRLLAPFATSTIVLATRSRLS